MIKRVLFSPVGTSDPIRDDCDGPMLHIVRHFVPDVIVLILTPNMTERHQHDDRFGRSIRELARLSGRASPEIHYEHISVSDPSDFEVFSKLYQKVMIDIRKRYPEAEVLVNVSSGTPQMIATACLLASSRFLGVKYRCIQVRHPWKESGERTKYLGNQYDDDVIGMLLDWDPDSEVHCRYKEPDLFTFTDTLIKQQLKQLIISHDYFGADQLCKKNNQVFSNIFSSSINAVKRWIDMDLDQAELLFSCCPELDRPINTKKRQEVDFLFAYMLGSEICFLRQEIDAYLLRISPLAANLIAYYIQINCRYNLGEVLTDQEDRSILDLRKLAQRAPGLLDYLNKKYANGFSSKDVSLHNLLLVLRYLDKCGQNDASTMAEAIKLFQVLRDVEDKLRNKVAHQIVKVDDAWCRKHTGHTFQSIRNHLASLFELVLKPHLHHGWLCFPQTFNNYVVGMIDSDQC